MTPNPDAPPNVEVADTVQRTAAPPLWNPNAAANWSLLFSPAFGAFVHMKNWQALGEAGKAATAKVWAVLALLVISALSVVSALLPDNKGLNGLSRFIVFMLLLSWYFSSGRKQAGFVKAHFGKSYPRRGWGKPLFFAILALVGFFVTLMIVFLIASMFRHPV